MRVCPGSVASEFGNDLICPYNPRVLAKEAAKLDKVVYQTVGWHVPRLRRRRPGNIASQQSGTRQTPDRWCKCPAGLCHREPCVTKVTALDGRIPIGRVNMTPVSVVPSVFGGYAAELDRVADFAVGHGLPVVRILTLYALHIAGRCPAVAVVGRLRKRSRRG